MNAYRFFLVVITAYFLFGCKKNDLSDLENTLLDLTNTQWRIEKVSDKATNDFSFYPKNLALYGISFQTEGKFTILGGCNYHRGNYSTGNKNIIKFSKLGPGTYLYCPGLHDWEMQIVYGLDNASTYRSDGVRLIIADGNREFHFQRIP